VKTLAGLGPSSLSRGKRPVSPVRPLPQVLRSHGRRRLAAPAMSVVAANREGTGFSLFPFLGGSK
jgi:hypothetical protein